MTLNIENFMGHLRAVVEERGRDYVYPGFDIDVEYDDDGEIVSLTIGERTERARAVDCVYRNPLTGEASCIIGRIVARVDPEAFEAIARAEKDNGYESFPVQEFHCNAGVDVFTDPQVEDLAGVVQALQDRGFEYGLVLDFAEAYVEADSARRVRLLNEAYMATLAFTDELKKAIHFEG